MSVTQPIQIDRLPPNLDVKALAAVAETLTLSEARYLRGPTLAPHKTACGSRAGVIQPRLGGWDFPDRLRPTLAPHCVSPYPALCAGGALSGCSAGVVPVARWLQVLRGRQDEREKDLASEEEAIGYVSCVSLDAPLDRDWAEIFFYLGQQVFPRWYRISGQPVHVALGLDRPIVLHDQQLADLTRFRRWLRRKVEGGAKRSAPIKRNPSSRSYV